MAKQIQEGWDGHMTSKAEAANSMLQKPAQRQLEHLAALLPLDGPLPEKPGGADYGIVMQRGKMETWAIKQQPVDVKESHADEAAMTNQSLVVQAIPRYMKRGFKGVLMPCVYMRTKPNGMKEVGISYFGGADPSDVKTRRGLDPLIGLDPKATHGIGFGKMVTVFMECLADASAETGIPLFTAIDMDHRPRSALGALLFSFLVHGQDLYCLKIKPPKRDPTWVWLKSVGISTVYALPSVPLAIED
jgi:hypothetical protein